MQSHFKTIALIQIQNKKLLLTKSKNKNAFYMPGGKIEPGETHQQTLIRELQEELDVQVIPNSITFYGEFTNQAYGMPEGTLVTIHCYQAKVNGEFKEHAEIEKLHYFSYQEYLQMPETAPAVRLIFEDLVKRKMVED